MWLPPGHADSGSNDGSVLGAGAPVVCCRHRPLSRTRRQPQDGLRVLRAGGDSAVCGSAGAARHWHLRLPPYWPLSKACAHPKVHPHAGKYFLRTVQIYCLRDRSCTAC